jgi:hypothetical protein
MKLKCLKEQFRSRRPLWLALVGLLLMAIGAPLLASPSDFSTIQTSLQSSEHHTLGILGSSSICGGIVFFVSSIFQFHRWKQNPQQISVGQGVFMLLIGVAMISLPFTMSTAKRAVLGQNEQITKFGDSQLANIVAPQSLDEGE